MLSGAVSRIPSHADYSFLGFGLPWKASYSRLHEQHQQIR